MQTVAQTYSARVTFISGDVHCGGFGCFQAHPKQFNRVVDHKYMLQVRSEGWAVPAGQAWGLRKRLQVVVATWSRTAGPQAALAE
jgi:hypothetical protein